MDVLMRIGDNQGRLCLIKRENCLVYTVMAALFGIAFVFIWLLFIGNKTASYPVYTLHASVVITNPLPRELDVAQLSLKLPLSFDAEISDSTQSVQVQKSGMRQQLFYTPAKVAAGSEHALSMDISLSELHGVDQRGPSSELPHSDAIEEIPTLHEPLSSDDGKQLDDTVLNAVKQAKTLTEYQELFSQLDPARIVSSANSRHLNNAQAIRYSYLLGLIKKAIELKQSVTLVSGWVFDQEGRGSYQLWAEVYSGKQKANWPSMDNQRIYLPAETVNVAEFIGNPAPFFSPVSGFGLEVKELNVTLLKQK
ncbi:MAG: hypothetical protein ACRCRW_02355 [Aeromonadaceae bacterium]